MKFEKRFRLLRVELLLIFGLMQPMLFAQTPTHRDSTTSGVYTAAQAQEGKVIYQSQCAMCHGASLEGQGQFSPLAGTLFLNKWSGLSVSDLFGKTIIMMPAMNPGSMTPDDTAKLIAYILSVNKFPAGAKALPSDPQSLEMIVIDKP